MIANWVKLPKDPTVTKYAAAKSFSVVVAAARSPVAVS